MQKVEGSNPFSRFEEGLRLQQVFFVGAVRFVRLHPQTLIGHSQSTKVRSAREKALFCRGILVIRNV